MSFGALLLLGVGSAGGSAATTAAATVITGKPPALTRRTNALFSFSANSAAPPPAYTVTELAPGIASKATDLNESGAVVGLARVGTASHAMLWSGVTTQDLGTLGGANSYAYAINDAGAIVGAAQRADGVLRPVRWRDGVIEDLGFPALAGDGRAIAIDASGQILANNNGFIWRYSGGTWTKLDDGAALDMNDNGLILRGGYEGVSSVGTGALGAWTFLWPIFDQKLAAGYDLNSAGDVVGRANVLTPAGDTPFFYRDGVLFDLGESFGFVGREALAINDAGQMLIDGNVPGSGEFLYLYGDGVLHDVNTLIPPGSGWTFGPGGIIGAYSLDTSNDPPPPGSSELNPPTLNDGGQIAITVRRDGRSNALLLAPADAAVEPCAAPQGYGVLADGLHTFSVRATDGAGNVGPVAGYSWTVDTQAPAVTITQQPGNPSSGSATFIFTSDAGATFECSLDGGAYSACASPTGYSALAEGSHTFAVRATDAAGNRGSDATYTWAVDKTGPSVTITEAPPELTNATSASFAFSAEPGATFQCARDAEGFTDCTSPKSYSGLSVGTHSFSVRAIDTLGNVGPATTHSWTVDACPCTLFSPSSQPAVQNVSTQDGRTGQASYSYELGLKVTVDRPMQLDAIRFYKSSQETGTHVGTIWNSSGVKLASVTFTSESASGWQAQHLATPYALEAGRLYVVSVNANSRFGVTRGGLANAVVSGPLHSWPGIDNGVYGLAAGTYPSSFYQSSNYFVDVEVASPGSVADTTPPTVTITQAPTSPSPERSPSFAFSSEPGATFECKLDAAPFVACSSPITYAGVAEGSHTFSVRAADGAGNVSAPATHTWTIERLCPCSLFSPLDQPGAQDLSTQDGRTGRKEYTYELGVKVKVDRPMEVRALEFFKSSREVGVHVGTIWSASGSKLASATFVSETASGWQQQPLATPYLLEAGVVYVISVNANAFFGLTSLGLANELKAGPLRSVADGLNGVYNGSAGLFPSSSYRSSNYFVDLEVADAGNVPPTVTITNAPSGSTLATNASFSFSSEAGATFECKLDGGVFEACTSPKTYTWLAVGSHTFSVRATDVDGNVGPAATATWTIIADPCPCTLFSPLVQPAQQNLPTQDGRSGQSSYTYELGVKVKVDRQMQVSALKFFKSAQETGTHTGTIWSASGVKLATVTFASETASGWQRQPLAMPFLLEPGVVYVVSVNANTHFALTGLGLANEVGTGPLRSVADGQNGVYGLAAGSFPSNSYQSSNYFADLEVVSAG